MHVRARAAELERSIASDGRSAPPQPGGCLVFNASIYRDLAPSGRQIDLKLTATECPSYGGSIMDPPRRHPPCQAGMSTMGPDGSRCCVLPYAPCVAPSVHAQPASRGPDRRLSVAL